jgi:hypothetical protein
VAKAGIPLQQESAMADHPRDEVEDADLITRLYRRMANYKECWRRCKSPACRRRKTCLGDAMECQREGKPPPELTEAERSEAMHDLRTQLKAQLAVVRAQDAEGQRLTVAGKVAAKWTKPARDKSAANMPSAKSRAAKRQATDRGGT